MRFVVVYRIETLISTVIHMKSENQKSKKENMKSEWTNAGDQVI